MATEIRSVCFCGIGAIGSAYASKIAEYDNDMLSVLVDAKRKSIYQEKGIYINGRKYGFNLVTPEEIKAPYDLIIIAVKQHHLEEIISLLQPAVGSNTIIMSLLNGISSEEILGKAFGMEKMLYSFCVGTDMVREGTNTTFSNMGRIVFGEQSNEQITARVKAVSCLLRSAEIPHIIPADMMRELWWKFMMNVGLNQVTAILGASYGIISNVKEASELAVMASREVVMLSAFEGINLSESDIDKYLKIVSGLALDGKTSMHQDIEAGRKTEVEIFAGKVIELGKKHRVPTPVNEILYLMLRALEGKEILKNAK